MSVQEKLEWVTPKISLMDAEDTEGSGKTLVQSFAEGQCTKNAGACAGNLGAFFGPS
ncbi:hypothetical protein SynSYN20_01756 [Synechococcus sp. SYN20]|nr:hypothetical protein SynSYN20_01756 [Synechococcus sp. SYN20]